MKDLIEEAARRLTDLEADILIRYLGGESASDIAINVEDSGGQMAVRDIINAKGQGGSATYIKNLLVRRRDLRAAASARNAAPAPPVPDRRLAAAAAARPVTKPAQRVAAPAKRVAAKRPGPPPVRRPAAPVVTRAPETSSPTVDVPVAVRQADSPVTDRDEPTALGTGAPAPAGEHPATGQEPAMATTETTAVVPAPRTGSTTTAPAPEPVRPPEPMDRTGAHDGDLVLPASIDDLLQLAYDSGSEQLHTAADQLRDGVQALRTALVVEHRAAGLRTQIAELDGEIEVLTTKRDRLRQELTELLAGDVTVSVSSRPRRDRPAPDAEPGGDDEIREWAKTNGFTLGPRNTIPGGVRAAYRARAEKKE